MYKIGETYRTRRGEKAVVEDEIGGKLTGRIGEGLSAQFEMWNPDGFCSDKDHPYKNDLVSKFTPNDTEHRAELFAKAGQELAECAKQLGWTSSQDTKWIKRAEAAVEEWQKAMSWPSP